MLKKNTRQPATSTYQGTEHGFSDMYQVLVFQNGTEQVRELQPVGLVPLQQQDGMDPEAPP